MKFVRFVLMYSFFSIIYHDTFLEIYKFKICFEKIIKGKVKKETNRVVLIMH